MDILGADVHSIIQELIQVENAASDPFVSVQRKSQLKSRIEELKRRLEPAVQQRLNEIPLIIFLDYVKTIECNQQKRYLKSALTRLVSEGLIRLPLENLSELINMVEPSQSVDYNAQTAASDAKLIQDVIKLLDDPYISYNRKNRLRKLLESLPPDNLSVCESQDEENARRYILDSLGVEYINAVKKSKSSKKKLRDQMASSPERLLRFEGTNMNFLEGYGVLEPDYVRCIHVWNSDSACES